MVLAEMGGRIIGALQQLSNATIIDEKVLTECLNEISRALMSADVQFKMIGAMQSNIKKTVNLDDRAAGHNKRKIIQQVCVSENFWCSSVCVVVDLIKDWCTNGALYCFHLKLGRWW